MMRARNLALIAAGALIAALLLWQETTITATRQRNQTLAAQVQAADSPPIQSRGPAASATDEPSAQAAVDRAELERLRAQTESLRTQLQQAQTNRAAVRKTAGTSTAGRGSAQPGYISLSDAQDVGAATSEAALQSFVWAMRTADTNRLMGLIDASAEGSREEIEQMLRELPAAVARGDLERDAATKSFRVVREVALPDGDIALVVEDVGGRAEDVNGGNTAHRTALRMRRAGSDWRIVAGKHGPDEVKLDPAQMGD